MNIILVFLGLGVIIFIHELGHFLVAKFLRIKVLQFSFGLGHEIVGKTFGETRYSICILPFGGSVRLKGENLDEEKTEDSFFGKKWYQRSLVAVSGPLMNYLLATVIFIYIAFVFGVGVLSDKPIIGEVIENKPAAVAGLMPKDEILKINKKPISSWKEMAAIIHASENKELELEVLRDGKVIKVKVTPIKDPVAGYGVIGITPGYSIEKVSLSKAFHIGISQPISMSIISIKYIINKIIKLEKPELAGPVGVFQVLSNAAKSTVEHFLYTLGLISVMVGLFNLFPIPILDGGHIFFALVEGITKKPVEKKFYEVANYIGLGVIIGIFLFATYSDILRMLVKR